MPTFSERQGLEVEAPPIRYRNDASESVRDMTITLARKHGLQVKPIRALLCNTLLVSADPDNWSEPNIESECRILIGQCAWHEVYDTIEALGGFFSASLFSSKEKLEAFQSDINRLLVKDGAAWQMVGGQIVARGSDSFNILATNTRNTLEHSGNVTAASEIHEAIMDISRRPNPDKTGAVHHAMGAIECITRSMASDPKSTLGDLVKSSAKAHGIPRPLDEAINKMWGYSSERGRHIREGDEPSFEEAELIVTIAAAICTYLSKKTL